LRQGVLGGLYVMKKSSVTGKMYKYYCKDPLTYGQGKKKQYFNKMLEATKRVGHYDRGAKPGFCKYMHNAAARKLNVNN
jgi:hypothetical protein